VRFTVFGGSGFIGGATVEFLRADGHEVVVPGRHAPVSQQGDLGHVIYAAGVTADFRSRPFDTMRAHVGLVAEILEHGAFDSLLYLSSARVYRHGDSAREDAAIAVRSEDSEDFYDLTKLAGESLCHASGRPNVRVARLANVVGRDFRSSNFVFDLIRAACRDGRIELRSAPESEKDYVMVDDVVAMLERIALRGKCRCYNVAAGCNITHARMVGAIAESTGAVCTVIPGAPRINSPPIDIGRLQAEFGYAPREVLSEIPALVDEYRKAKHAEN